MAIGGGHNALFGVIFHRSESENRVFQANPHETPTVPLFRPVDECWLTYGAIHIGGRRNDGRKPAGLFCKTSGNGLSRLVLLQTESVNGLRMSGPHQIWRFSDKCL